MAWRRLTLRSMLVAALVGLLTPAMWFIVTGETHRTPGIETSAKDKMTEAERAAWIEQNAKPVSLWEHMKGTPGFIADHWRGYLEASAVIFLIVLVINGAFLTGRKDEP